MKTWPENWPTTGPFTTYAARTQYNRLLLGYMVESDVWMGGEHRDWTYTRVWLHFAWWELIVTRFRPPAFASPVDALRALAEKDRRAKAKGRWWPFAKGVH